MPTIQKSNFKRLIGTWKTEGTILDDKQNQQLEGVDSYEFILDGNYILHKADVKMGNEKSETFEIIVLEDSTEKASMHYYNSKGESGVMTGFLVKNDFKIKGDKLKFEGTLNEENTMLVGKWSLRAANGDWTEYIDLKLTKQH